MSSDSPFPFLHDIIRPLIAVATVLIVALFVSGVILGQFPSFRRIGSKGNLTLVGVGVFLDANCTTPVESIDWGSVEPSSVKNHTVFVRNEGNEPSTLFLNTTSWDPQNASNFMILNWDYNGHIIYPQQIARVTLTLYIKPIIEGIKDFTFDIIIGVNE